jgi:hypothetical protein
MLMKLTAGVNFINVKCSKFLYERHFSIFYYVHVTREKLPKQCLYEKFVRSLLMKLTPGEFHQRSYEQLLWVQIPKAQKDTCDLTVCLPFWDLGL